MVSSDSEHTTQHGAIEGKPQTRSVNYYNLDAIIAVGYRVNSKRATQFRIWVTKILKEYIIKGYAMDDERLKQTEKLPKSVMTCLMQNEEVRKNWLRMQTI